MHVCVCGVLPLLICMCVYAFMSTSVCVYVCVCVCVSVCRYVFIFLGGFSKAGGPFPPHFIVAQFPVNQCVHQPGLALPPLPVKGLSRSQVLLEIISFIHSG